MPSVLIVSPTKKEIERWQFDRFRALLTSFPEGQIEPSEEPDFLIQSPDRRLGIELTELHRDTPAGTRPQQVQEAMRHRIVARANDLFRRAGGPPLHVSVHFNDSYAINKTHVNQLAEQIATLLLRNIPAAGETFEEEYNWLNRAYFPERVHRIAAHNIAGSQRSFFTSPGATWMVPLTPTDIDRVLESKEPKYSRYRKRCDEVWLVINCNVGMMSTWFEHTPEAFASEHRSSFDRSFVFSHFSQHVAELRLLARRGV